MARNQHVTPHPNGGWQVKATGNRRDILIKMNNNEFFEITKEVIKEISKDVYEDIISLVAKPTGAVLGLIPRAIKAALSPLEKMDTSKGI